MKTRHQPTEVAEDRVLTDQERTLVEWLLEHGTPTAKHLVRSVSSARVIRTCGCGCASVDFSISGKEPPRDHGMVIISDYLWRTDQDNLCGCFVFTIGGQLAGLEVWSVDGGETPADLPHPEQLRPWAEKNAV